MSPWWNSIGVEKIFQAPLPVNVPIGNNFIVVGSDFMVAGSDILLMEYHFIMIGSDVKIVSNHLIYSGWIIR